MTFTKKETRRALTIAAFAGSAVLITGLAVAALKKQQAIMLINSIKNHKLINRYLAVLATFFHLCSLVVLEALRLLRLNIQG